ncbi:MAG: galactose mutarotase [Cyclobacteriaceae bacterium]
MNIEENKFGKTNDGSDVNEFALSNDNGMKLKIINYGGIITSIKTPDKDGNPGQVVLGYDSLQPYLENPYFFGCLVGRFANRIVGGKFSIDGKNYQLAVNNGPNHLHGGPTGFHSSIWNAQAIENENKVSVVLKHFSPDGHENFPGNLDCTVIYSLNNDNALEIEYQAITDKPTIINLTNHSYFNLNDGGKSDILDHGLQIEAEEHTVKDGDVPNGEFGKVEGSAFDFRIPSIIGENLKKGDHSLKMGFDNNFVLKKEASSELKKIATAYSDKSGREMTVFSTTPGVQLYTAGYVENEKGIDGILYKAYHGFCLETQYFPDAPNISHFPSTVLRPGEEYNEKTIYQFGVLGT